MIGSVLRAIHPNPLVALCVVLFGTILGFALSLSEWRSKLGFTTIGTSLVSILTSLTADRLTTVKDFIASTALLTPILLTLNIFLATFLLSLLVSSVGVFGANLVRGRRAGDREAWAKAVRKGVAIFGNGILHYATHSPDRVAEARIKELSTLNDILWLIHKFLVAEVAAAAHGREHFIDEVKALGHMLLQHTFGDGTDLQHYRMAFFERRGDRLEYLVTVNNGDWTSHSGQGFDIATSFMGEAIRRRMPLVYPKDKKWQRVPYAKRKRARYKSFIAIPTPCDHSVDECIGVLTVDSTNNHEVFTEPRVEGLVAFVQLVYALYLLNIPGGIDG